MVIASPSDEEIKHYSELKKQEKQERLLLKKYINKPTVTKSGEVKAVYANIAKAEDVHSAVVNGAEGIGLFRTEFLYMDRTEAPSEDEQFEAYSTVAKAMGGKEVIIRTLDVGGDKHIEYLQIEKKIIRLWVCAQSATALKILIFSKLSSRRCFVPRASEI